MSPMLLSLLLVKSHPVGRQAVDSQSVVVVAIRAYYGLSTNQPNNHQVIHTLNRAYLIYNIICSLYTLKYQYREYPPRLSTSGF